MITTAIKETAFTKESMPVNSLPQRSLLQQKRLSAFEKNITWMAIRLRIFFIACTTLRSLKKIRKGYNALLQLRKTTWSGNMKKMYKVDGKYYFNLYTPGWPSAAYDHLIKSELLRYASPLYAADKLRFIFLAVTRKCPLRCEHCFEWDNLNQKETFTKNELIQIVDIYQKEGVNQIQFSGGEPMVRIKDLVEVIRFA